MMYAKIIEAIKAEAAQAKTSTANYINADENNMKRESTATRWTQYKRSEISREKCAEYATERAARRIDKETAAADQQRPQAPARARMHAEPRQTAPT